MQAIRRLAAGASFTSNLPSRALDRVESNAVHPQARRHPRIVTILSGNVTYYVTSSSSRLRVAPFAPKRVMGSALAPVPRTTPARRPKGTTYASAAPLILPFVPICRIPNSVSVLL